MVAYFCILIRELRLIRIRAFLSGHYNRDLKKLLKQTDPVLPLLPGVQDGRGEHLPLLCGHQEVLEVQAGRKGRTYTLQADHTCLL